MAKVQKRTFSIPQDQSDFLDAKLAGGGYSSTSEIVREGLRILQKRDAVIDRWMVEEVLPSFDRWIAEGKPTRSSDDVFKDLEARIRERAARKAS